MDIMARNELKVHILSLATHTARSMLFLDIAHTREIEGKKEVADKYRQKATEEATYAERKREYIWEIIDNM